MLQSCVISLLLFTPFEISHSKKMLLGFSNSCFHIIILRVLSGVVVICFIVSFVICLFGPNKYSYFILSYITKTPGTCQILNGGCDDICIPTGEGRECKCDAGSQLQADSTMCSTSKWGAISRH